MSERIYNQPNHPQYGPVRRMRTVLQVLNITDEKADSCLKLEKRRTWDEFITFGIDCGWPEALACRTLLKLIL